MDAANPAKRYSSIKYALAIIDTFCLLVLLLVFVGGGFSQALSQIISIRINNNYLILPLYLLSIYLAYSLLDLPLGFYRGFILEHKFSLSTQKLGDWFKDQLKAGMIGYLISVVLLAAFYYILARFPQSWWIIAWVAWVFFNLVFAKLVPVVIIPLFFKYKKLSDALLRERINALAFKMKVKILDVLEIDLSKKSLKANAAFVGMGQTRRVILSDTLKDKYDYDEIEVILAHEFAHYRMKHLLKLVFFNSAITLLVFYLLFKTSQLPLGFFGFSSLSDIAAMPIVILYLVIFELIVQPLQNYISRKLEKSADKMALEVTGLKGAFISMMDKLSTQNLADRNPHPIIKFFFFDHPPVDERISLARQFYQ